MHMCSGEKFRSYRMCPCGAVSKLQKVTVRNSEHSKKCQYSTWLYKCQPILITACKETAREKNQSKERSYQKEHTETLAMIMRKPTTGSVYKPFYLFLCLNISAFPLCLLTFLHLSRCRTLWAMSYHGCILSVWSSLDPFSF